MKDLLTTIAILAIAISLFVCGFLAAIRTNSQEAIQKKFNQEVLQKFDAQYRHNQRVINTFRKMGAWK